ncbi:MAG: hypothetical protein AAF583_13780 [Pseudomonadota bacterium]
MPFATGWVPQAYPTGRIGFSKQIRYNRPLEQSDAVLIGKEEDRLMQLSQPLTFVDQIEQTSSLLQKVAFLKGLSPHEKYMRSFVDAALRLFIDFREYRDSQRALVLKNFNEADQKELRASFEFRDYERRSVLALEGIYTYMHRAFWFVRIPHGEVPKIDVRDEFGCEKTAKEWLQDFRFVSEYRNKIIEHAPENLSFYTGWGQHYNVDDPYDFRLWILERNLVDLLKTHETIVEQIKSTQAIIADKIMLPSLSCKELPYSFCFDFLAGAHHLSNSQMDKVFRKVLIKTGCVSHQPEALIAKLHNFTSFVFRKKMAAV